MVNEVNHVSLKDNSSCEKAQEPKTIDSDASSTLPATAGRVADTDDEVETSRDVADEGIASLERPRSESEGTSSSTYLDLSELPGVEQWTMKAVVMREWSRNRE